MSHHGGHLPGNPDLGDVLKLAEELHKANGWEPEMYQMLAMKYRSPVDADKAMRAVAEVLGHEIED